MKDCSISCGTDLFSPSRPRSESFPYVLRERLVHPYPPVLVYRKTLNLYRKFKFIGNFKVIQYFVTVVEPNCQWLEFHVKIHSIAGKTYVFSAQTVGKGSLFSKALAEISTVTHRTSCLRNTLFKVLYESHLEAELSR